MGVSRWFGALLVCGGASWSTAALADDDPSAAPAQVGPSFEESFPKATIKLERLPPRYSYDFGLSLSYGTVTYWDEIVPPWIGFGMRGAYGRNKGNHRFGADVHLVAEGPIGVHTSLALEPHLSWDLVTGGGLLLGAGVGPALMYHASAGPSTAVRGERAITFGPSAVARLGWSQGWSRVGRRLFVYVEPKMRVVNGELNPLMALVVGSGRGF